MKHVIHCHGFASSPASKKAELLKTKFKTFCPRVPYDYREVSEFREEIRDYLNEHAFPEDEVIFSGCSLGAYWAIIAAYEFDGKAILFNPVIDPSKELVQFLGKNKNYCTGEDFELTTNHIKSFSPLNELVLSHAGNVIVYKNDPIIDVESVLALFPNSILLDSDDQRFTDYEKLLSYISAGFRS